MHITRPLRTFVAQDAQIENWDSIAPYFEDLLNRDIASVSDLQQWLKDQSELEAILEENLAWRYIRMTIDTREEALSKAYSFFVSEIQPKIAPFEDQLNRKLVASPFIASLKDDPAYAILLRSVEKSLE